MTADGIETNRKQNTKLTIYHGSDKIVKEPKYGYGSYDNDYGSGFYTSEDIEKGRSWSVLFGSKDAINNIYEVDTTGMNILYLDDYGPLAWVAELLYNRGAYFEGLESTVSDFTKKYKVDTTKADIIIGYRAGGNYMEVIKSFLKGETNINEVAVLFKKEELGQQFVLKSKKAFDSVKFVGYEIVKNNNYEQQSIYSRKEMSNFMNNRTRQIQEESYIPQGLTIKEACKNKYDYILEYNYLKKDMSWEEYKEYQELLKLEKQEAAHDELDDSFSSTTKSVDIKTIEDVGGIEYEPN